MNSQFHRQFQAQPNAEQVSRKLMRSSNVAKRNTVDPSELRLFVKNLHPDTSEATLKAYFGRWGVVTDIFIRKGNHHFSGIRCNMAFITFASYFNDSPLSAYIHVIDQQSVPIYKVQAKPSRHPNGQEAAVENSRTIMINGTIQELSEIDLISHFSKFGKPTKIVRKVDPSNPKMFQRFAFVVFAEAKSADVAMIQELQVISGQYVDIRRVKDVDK